MSFATMCAYVENGLAADTAAYLNTRVNSFKGYFGGNGYFNEDTVKTVMVRMLANWIAINDANETTMVFSELNYIGFSERSDIAVIYRSNGGQPAPDQRLYMELKTDFSYESVNDDTDTVDLIAGAVNSPITQAYVCYTCLVGNTSWTSQIEAPTQANVALLQTPVDPAN